jgi:hypothetical protein
MTPAQPRAQDNFSRHDLERQARVLWLLAEVGAAVAALLARAWAGRTSPVGTGAGAGGGLAGMTLGLLAAIHDRVSRAVRLAITLRLRLEDQLARPGALVAVPADAGETGEPQQLGRLRAEALERLDSFPPEFSKAFLNRPVEDLIPLICRDLGLDPAWAGLAGGHADPPDLQQAAAAALETLAHQTVARQTLARQTAIRQDAAPPRSAHSGPAPPRLPNLSRTARLPAPSGASP